MRTKALVLGAKPAKLQGAWVPIDEAGVWECQVESLPRGIDLRGIVQIEVMDRSLDTPRTCSVDSEISGKFARAIIIENHNDADMISVRIMEKKPDV